MDDVTGVYMCYAHQTKYYNHLRLYVPLVIM